MDLDFFAVDNFDFTRNIVKKKKLGEKTRENVGVLSKLNFWTKIDFSNSVENESSAIFNRFSQVGDTCLANGQD